MKKLKLKNFLKLGVLIFGISIFLTNCQEDSLNDIQNDKFSNIRIKITDFNEITSNKNISKKLKSFSYKSKSSSSTYKDILYNAEYGFTIDTDIVKYVVSGDYHSYNFIITRDNPIDDKLENLVLSLNNDGGYNAYIIKYDFTPEEFENIDISELDNRKTLYTPIDFDSSFLQNKSSKSKMPNEYECDEVWGWEELDPGDEGYNVGEGNEEAPTYGWALISFDCGYSSESGGGSDPENYDGEGGSTSGGGDGGIVTAPNTTPYYYQLKNFESGTLSTEVRKYYQEDSNIKSTIDIYLIQNNFSYTSIQDAEASLIFGDSLDLDFEQFNWAFINRNSEDLYDIKDYLNEAINITPDIENFIKKVIDSEIETNNNAEIDFDDQVINSLEGKTLCIYNKLNSSSTGFKNAIKKFDGEFPVSHLKLENSSTLPSNYNAKTIPPSDFVITIQINENKLSRPNLSIARTIIHETIHAEMFRKLLSILDNGGDLDGLTRNQWIQKLANGDYPGIFDYYSDFGVGNMQHEQMAAHYITTISDQLEEFEPGHSQEVYDSLAWTGLIDTVAWNSLSQSEKNAIVSTINNFHNSVGSENCN